MDTKRKDDVEGLETPEGIMRPLVFGKNLFVTHLEVPPGLEVPGHGHPGEGVLFCLSGKLVAVSKEGEAEITGGTVLVVSPGEEVGIRNPTGAPARALLISSPPPAGSLDELKRLLGMA